MARPSNSGTLLGDSTSNGNGASGGINTGGQAWGLYAVNGAVSAAVRPFTGGSLTIGQSVTIDFDTGSLDSGNGPPSVGIGLQTLDGGTIATNRIQFLFTSGDASYSMQVGASTINSGVGFTTGGLHLTFTLTAANTMNLTVGSLNGSNGGTNSVFTGLSLGGVSGSGISQIRLFDSDAGSASNQDVYFNNLAVVPEPSTFALIATGGLA